MSKTKRVFEPGDVVETTAIGLDFGKNTATAKIRRVLGKDAEIIYGSFDDRTVIPLASCEFVQHEELAPADLADHGPTFVIS